MPLYSLVQLNQIALSVEAESPEVAAEEASLPPGEYAVIEGPLRTTVVEHEITVVATPGERTGDPPAA